MVRTSSRGSSRTANLSIEANRVIEGGINKNQRGECFSGSAVGVSDTITKSNKNMLISAFTELSVSVLRESKVSDSEGEEKKDTEFGLPRRKASLDLTRLGQEAEAEAAVRAVGHQH